MKNSKIAATDHRSTHAATEVALPNLKAPTSGVKVRAGVRSGLLSSNETF